MEYILTKQDIKIMMVIIAILFFILGLTIGVVFL